MQLDEKPRHCTSIDWPRLKAINDVIRLIDGRSRMKQHPYIVVLEHEALLTRLRSMAAACYTYKDTPKDET